MNTYKIYRNIAWWYKIS